MIKSPAVEGCESRGKPVEHPRRWRAFGVAPLVWALGLMAAGCDPIIELTPAPARTPGVAIGPFNSGSATAQSTITVVSKGYSGFVNLAASCCHNVIRDQMVTPAAGDVVLNFATNPLNLAKNGSASTTLDIFMPSLGSGPFGTLGPRIPFGKHVISVSASGSKVSATGEVGVTVVPSSEPAPGCKPGVESIPLATSLPPIGTSPPAAGILQNQIAAAEANPRATTLIVVIYRSTGPEAGGREAFKMTITDDSGLASQLAILTLVNKSPKNEEKRISTAGCSTLPKEIVAKKGQTSVQLMLVQAQDRTITFSEKCDDLVCLNTNWIDAIVFSEPAFWSVFGGKRVTFEWHECTQFLLWCV